jgi:hypothetical protein
MCPASNAVAEGVEDADGESRSGPLLDLVRGEPADPLGFIGLGRSSTDRTAAEDECHHAAGHVLVDAGQAIHGDIDAGLFGHLAADAFLEGLAEFEHPSGRFPPPVVASLDYEDTTVVPDDDTSDADEVSCGNAT